MKREGWKNREIRVDEAMEERRKEREGKENGQRVGEGEKSG